jgi:cob(I)alamin adenosyltransferase
MSRPLDIGSHLQAASQETMKTTAAEEASRNQSLLPTELAEALIVAIQQLEDWIDTMTEDLPGIAVLYFTDGDTYRGLNSYIARTVCRRAERTMVLSC